MDFSGCPDDDSFGPAVRGCRDDFDFTIKFEKIFFTLIPAPVFIALALCRIVYLARKPVIVGGVLLRTAKLATIGVLSILQLTLLAWSSTKSHRLAGFFIPADVVRLAAALCMLWLSYLEHGRAPRPSLLLNAYLFVTLLFDIAQVRTLWLASSNADETTFTRLFTCALALKAFLVVLESQSKTKWIARWDVKQHSPEETTGLYGLGAYFWLNRLFVTGYRKILEIHDLYPLDQTMASEALHAKLGRHLDVTNFRGRSLGLTRSLTKALAVPLLLPVAPRIALGALQFCQPFLIETLLSYLERPSESSSRNLGYGLIGAAILIYVGIATAGAFYWYFQERAMYIARGLLVKAIYLKTTESKMTTSGESEALTLMSADIERIITGCLNIHEFWANTVEIALSCWLLSRQIGPAFVAPLIVVGVCIICSAFLARLTGPRQKVWMEKIQKRVGLTSDIIGQMKHLKISGLSGPIGESIQAMRVDELKTGARFRIVMVFSATVGYMPLLLSPVFTFAFASRTLNVTAIFTSISYIFLLAAPLGSLFQTIPNLLAAFTCLSRIQDFLEQDPRFDFRDSPRPDHSETASDEEKFSHARSELTPTTRLRIRAGSFGWEPDKFILKNINLEIPTSQLTVVVGPVASGKSTLCKVLLGEVPVSHGEVIMASNRSRKIGYCDQIPYLSNATIRENIVGFSPFIQERYDEVVEATMLRPDLALLPEGDNTKVGSNGITLSGGQKQRVSMARALYLDTDLYVFDDILSGLDAETEERVFLRVFSPTGLIRRRNATCVLCTHSIRHLPLADHIVALGQDGAIVEQGTFRELLANEQYVHSLGVTENEKSDLRTPSTDAPNTPIKEERPKVHLGQSASPIKTELEDRARMTGDWAVYHHYFARINVIAKLAFVVFGTGWGFFSNWGTIWLKFWSEDISSPNPSHSNAFYNGLYALFQMSALVSLFCIALTTMTSMIKISGAKLHQETLTTVINAPLKFFSSTDIGIVVNLFSQDMTLIDGQLPLALLNLSLGVFECMGMAAVVATASPYLAIAYPFLAAVMYGLQKFYLRTSRQIRLLDLEAKSPLYSHFIDTIKGITTYRAFGWVQQGIEQNSRLLDTSQRPAYLLVMIQRWLSFALQIIGAILAVAVVTLSTQLRFNMAFTGASLVTLMSFGDSLAWLIKFYATLETSIGAISRLKTFSEQVESENREGEDLVPPKEWPFRGSIKIDGVSASYGTNNQDKAGPEHLALDNIRLSISPGEKIAICGRSGSGKSSLLLLLLRLLDPLPPCPSSMSPRPGSKRELRPTVKGPEAQTQEANNMTIDDLPLSSITRPLLRSRIIAIPQEPVFLPPQTPLRTNLDPHHAATPAECLAALQAIPSLWSFFLSSLSPGSPPSSRGSHDNSSNNNSNSDLANLEAGLETPLSPDTLSQGQKQLFNLARAILRRRVRTRELCSHIGDYATDHQDGGGVGVGGILLLDEVSSSVDRDTDEEMQRVIAAEFSDYTIVMVSHRLGMVMRFDRVVVMEEGRIVETGAPRELVEAEGSRFRELWLVGNKMRKG
ncbi:hypothetical protein VTK26DRAFT_9425 [Humicola hyalothermophila]